MCWRSMYEYVNEKKKNCLRTINMRFRIINMFIHD